MKWKNAELEVVETFKKGEFDKLLEYVKENEQAVLSGIATEDLIQTRIETAYGAGVMMYFEKFVENDSEKNALLKMGELKGYLECLDAMSRESQKETLAEIKFDMIRMGHKEYSAYFEDVVKALYKAKTAMNNSDFEEIILLESEIRNVFDILLENGFICFDEGQGYSLTESGMKIGKMLKRKGF